MQRALGWVSVAGFALAAILLGRFAIDLGRLHWVLGAGTALFYAAFLAVVGLNTASLARGTEPGPPLSGDLRTALALTVPVALLASVLDCMGLSFEGCTILCGVLMKDVAPLVSILVALYAFTGATGWILGGSVMALTLLVPNCICRNPVNSGWIDLLGKSPACYATSYAVFLLAAMALASRRRVVASLVLAWSFVAAMLAFWVGHHYFHVPW